MNNSFTLLGSIYFKDYLCANKLKYFHSELPQSLARLPNLGNLTINDLLTHTSASLSTYLNISLPAAESILVSLAEAIIDSRPLNSPSLPLSASKITPLRLPILQQTKYTTSNSFCLYFDFGSIIEFCGEAGAGKTQLALQSAISATEMSSDAKVLYISTEGDPPVQRLSQMISTLSFSTKNDSSSSKSETDILNRIWIQVESDVNGLISTLTEKIPKILSRLPPNTLKLIVIDSITAVFRDGVDENNRNWKTRSTIFLNLSSHLKRLSTYYKVGILITNQMTSNFSNSSNSSTSLIPALGHTWTTCINSRFTLTRSSSFRSSRSLTVSFCPYLPVGHFKNYIINSSGLVFE